MRRASAARCPSVLRRCCGGRSSSGKVALVSGRAPGRAPEPGLVRKAVVPCVRIGAALRRFSRRLYSRESASPALT